MCYDDISGVNGVEKEVVCPRCKTKMEYRVEIEFKENGGRIIRYYYWCPRCGYRLNDLVINVDKDDSKLKIVAEQYIIVKRREKQAS
jgi:C4-type Zn-finger protein